MIFCNHKSILESTQVVKFSIPTMFTKLLLHIPHNKYLNFKITNKVQASYDDFLTPFQSDSIKIKLNVFF